MTQAPELEWGWWDGIADSPALAANLYDESIGTTDDCLAEILPFLGLTEPGATIMDLGCGTGRLLGGVASVLPDAHLVGIDISERILDHARAREDLRNVQFWVCDGRTIPAIAGDGFDAAYSMGLFQHLPADACAGYVREVARVLRPGGRFRFQSVLGDEHAFLSHQTSPGEMMGWCRDEDFYAVTLEPSKLQENWQWLTAVKR